MQRMFAKGAQWDMTTKAPADRGRKMRRYTQGDDVEAQRHCHAYARVREIVPELTPKTAAAAGEAIGRNHEGNATA